MYMYLDFCQKYFIDFSFFPIGAVAEWRCSGLQIRECRFDSGPCLQNSIQYNSLLFGFIL